jgi:hypothetical protein
VLSSSSPAWGIVALATIASRNVLVPLDPCMETGALAAALGRVRPAILFSSAACSDIVSGLTAGGSPLFRNGILKSIQVSNLILYIEELAGRAVDAEQIKPGVFRNIDTIHRSFFAHDYA